MREFFPVIKNSALFQGISEDDLDGMLTCLGGTDCFLFKEPADFLGRGTCQPDWRCVKWQSPDCQG